MERDNFTEVVRSFKNRNPFRPFTIALVNGNRYEIDRSEVIALGEGMAVMLAPGNVPVYFDHEGVSKIIGDLANQGSSTI